MLSLESFFFFFFFTRYINTRQYKTKFNTTLDETNRIPTPQNTQGDIARRETHKKRKTKKINKLIN